MSSQIKTSHTLVTASTASAGSSDRSQNLDQVSAPSTKRTRVEDNAVGDQPPAKRNALRLDVQQMYLRCSDAESKLDIMLKLYGLISVDTSIIFVTVSNSYHEDVESVY
jgi:hypothetical protein